jgi:Glycosyl transferase family 2
MHAPEVTVVVVANERFDATERSLDRLQRYSGVPFHLVCVDGGAPAYVRDMLRERSVTDGFELVRRETFLRPNAARNLGLARATTPYVAFLTAHPDDRTDEEILVLQANRLTGRCARARRPTRASSAA